MYYRTGILGTNATPFFVRFPVPPCCSAYVVIGNGIQCLVLRAVSEKFIADFLFSLFNFINCDSLVQCLPKQAVILEELLTLPK